MWVPVWMARAGDGTLGGAEDASTAWGENKMDIEYCSLTEAAVLLNARLFFKE